MAKTPSFETVSTKRQRIAELAKQNPTMAFTSLNHYLDVAWLREAYQRTRKDGAPGVDGQTWAEYGENLEANLRSLLDRAKSGTYRAPPVRRVHIPKGTGSETRPIGIPTLEDKVLQRAVAMILETIYEQDFYEGSYGFRPGRSAHQALESLWQQTMSSRGGWILDMDIRKFFDTLDHGHLRAFLQHRVRDGVLSRLIGKWLNAGVMEKGSISYPDSGSPQGGVISPILANVFLHYVLDCWFVEEVMPRMRGRAFLIRYANDAVMGFTGEEDARRVLAVLAQYFGKYGLTLHPEKTRLVEFRPPSQAGRPRGVPPGDRQKKWISAPPFALLADSSFQDLCLVALAPTGRYAEGANPVDHLKGGYSHVVPARGLVSNRFRVGDSVVWLGGFGATAKHVSR